MASSILLSGKRWTARSRAVGAEVAPGHIVCWFAGGDEVGACTGVPTPEERGSGRPGKRLSGAGPPAPGGRPGRGGSG